MIETLNDRLITERLRLVLFINELLDCLFDAFTSNRVLSIDIRTIDATNARIEELLEFEKPLRAMHVLARRHP